MVTHAQKFRELKLEGLGRDFGTHNALRNVNLTIKRGESIALLGPSGCGKSTTLNILAGLLPATAGLIRIDDQRIDNLRPEQRGFGMVFQNYALFPHMTVRKNIGFGLAMRGTPKAEAERRIDEAIALVRLQQHEHKLPGQLSGGQQQRVAIARAIVVEPPLVLMDEPLSNLDAKLRLEMRAEIRRIHNTLGSTTVYVTHDQEEALSLADRIVVMRDGEVRQVGTPQELYSHPKFLDVAEFMGFRNRVRGRVVSVADGSATIQVGGASITGRTQDALKVGADAVAAIRTEDLIAGPDGAGLGVTLLSTEFRGQEFVGFGRSADGADLSFRVPGRMDSGSQVSVTADPQRVVIFAEGQA